MPRIPFPFTGYAGSYTFPYEFPNAGHGQYRGAHGAVNFFNRCQEIEKLNKLLKSEPQLSVLTGPVNSGKSILVMKIIRDIKKAKIPVLTINLRDVSFNSVHSFVTILEKKLATWLQQYLVAADEYRLDASLYGLHLKLGKTRRGLPSIATLDQLFEKISAKLPPRTFWGKIQTPIFVIDEANELSALRKDPDGHDALMTLFKWLVLNTKELNLFHTLLISSDSFFHLWVAKYIGTSRYINYVIGDLDKSSAEIFWKEKLCAVEHQNLPDFEEVYKICGGNMFLLKKMYSEHVINNGATHPQDFFMIAQEKVKLTKALFVPDMQNHFNYKALWSRDQLIEVMETMVKAEERFLKYDELCSNMGKSVVDSLIANNLLHLRPTKRFSDDLTFQAENVPVLTPETPCGFIAMEHLLTELKK